MKEKCVENNKKFYKNLFWYKSIFFKNVKFISKDNSDEEFNNIVNALNIKKKKDRIKFIYEYCCEKIDSYNKGKNICGFNEKGQCIAQQAADEKIYKNGCCRLCRYQNPNGCPTSNIACKLFYCSRVTEKYQVIQFKDLKIFKLFTLRQRIIIQDDFFTPKEKVLKDLYVGSIVIYVIRMAIRLIINFLNLKKNKFI